MDRDTIMARLAMRRSRRQHKCIGACRSERAAACVISPGVVPPS